MSCFSLGALPLGFWIREVVVSSVDLFWFLDYTCGLWGYFCGLVAAWLFSLGLLFCEFLSLSFVFNCLMYGFGGFTEFVLLR